jgi:hypothetical protein
MQLARYVIYNFAAIGVGIFYWYDWKMTVGIELLV